MLQTWLVRDDLLQPELQRADVVVVIPYERIGDKILVGLAGSPQVNNIVLVSDGAEEIVPSPRRAVDAMLRFLTLQRFSLLSNEYGENFAVPSVKRIQRILHSGRGAESVILYGGSAPDDRQAVDRIEFVQQVSTTRILGRVLFRIWPISRIGPVR